MNRVNPVDVVAEGEVPGAVDLRLVPDVVMTVATCLAVPALPYDVAATRPWILAAGALVATGLVVWGGQVPHRSWPGTVAALAACALWIAAVAAVQAVGDRAPVVNSGWEGTVTAERPVRMSGETSRRPVRSAGTSGESWHLAVAVESFGQPLRDVPGGADVDHRTGNRPFGSPHGVLRSGRDRAAIAARTRAGRPVGAGPGTRRGDEDRRAEPPFGRLR